MKTARRQRASDPQNSYESHFEHTALFEFSKIINSSLDLKFILSHILLTIMGKILCSKGLVVLARGRGEYAVEMAKGFPAEVTGITMKIGRLPRSLLYVDRVSPARYPWMRAVRRSGVKLLLPMYVADEPLGLLGFGQRFSRKKLHTREETYLRSLANISATAIEKSRIVTEVQEVNRKLDRKIQELNTLFELGKEFSAVLDPDRVIKLLVYSLLGQIGVSRYLVCVRKGPDMRIVASRLDGQVPQGELLRMLGAQRGPALLSDLLPRKGGDVAEALLAIGMKVVIPMQTQGESKGFILLGEKLTREAFSASDLELLSSLANLAISALENARLFKEAIEKQRMEDELQIAREIQKGLLPSVLPSIPGIDIAAANISSKQVGGDYYDVISLNDGRYVIAIGDVSGKGTPAALLMANLQATIRALIPLQISLSDLTRRVNDLICQNTGADKFITFFWGIVNSEKKTLTYVNAGHNLPYLFHADGSFDRLDRGGMILGVLKTTVPYDEATLQLRPGDVLVLFTDGVSEAMNNEVKEYGEARLESLLLARKTEGSQAIIESIRRDIEHYAGGAPQSDDITLMVVKIT